jgi:Icc-related predicted phosphoesterase
MGNHDLFEHPGTKKTEAIRMVSEVATYLEDSSVVIDGLKIHGSPWTPRFFDWAFNADRGRVIRKHWDKIPDDCACLITHGPPYGILDEAPRGVFGFENVGCQDLLDRIKQLPDLKLHAYGHIHREANDIKTIVKGNTTFVNASTCDGAYLPVNPPVVIDL